MSYTYDQRKRYREPEKAETRQTDAPGPGMEALMSGRAAPSAAQKGQPFDLDAAMKTKMENAFGDLSSVKFYKSQAVGDAGAEAIARGNEIAFAPGMADFSTRAGQERLGHELSHVMSQRSGRVRGSGFLANASLEARADWEGAMAAAGQQVYGGPVDRTLSAAAPSPMSAGAMQAFRDQKQKNVPEPELIHEQQHWGDVKWGLLEKWNHRRKHLKNKLEYSEDRDAVQRRGLQDMVMAEGRVNDSVYIPDPDDEVPEEGYNTVDDPITADPFEADDERENGRLRELLGLIDTNEEEEFDPNQSIMGESPGVDYSQNLLPMQEPELKPKKKKWYQFWK